MPETSTTLASAVEREKTYSGGAYLFLLELTLPSGESIRLVRNNEDVEWPEGSGTLWQAVGFNFDDIDESSKAETRQLTFKIKDPSRAMLRHLEELEAWRKEHGREAVQARLLMVNSNLLHQDKPEGVWWFEDKGASAPPPMDTVFVRVGTDDVFSRQVPRRNVLRDFCAWDLSSDCPHVGECDRSLSACRNTYDNSIHFGGFPMVEDGAIYE